MSSHMGPSVTQQQKEQEEMFGCNNERIGSDNEETNKDNEEAGLVEEVMERWKQNMNPSLGIVQEKLRTEHSDWQV